MGLPFGVLLAVGSALASSVGFLMRHRGAVAAPQVDARHPLGTASQLFRQRWWAFGYAVAVLAWLLHIGSLNLAPLSLVQAALASSFVFLGVAAERLFGLRVGRRQWAGMGLAAGGLALLGLTVGDAQPHGANASYTLPAAIAVEAVLVAAGVALIAAPSARRRAQGGRGLLLATAAGLLFTVSHVGVKALSGMLRLSDPAGFLTPWVPLIVGASVVAFFASARSLQLGDAVAVIAVTGASSNVTAIAAGIVVFGDPVGDNALIVALRVAAFALVVVAAALMPAPMRAAREGRARAPAREPVAA